MQMRTDTPTRLCVPVCERSFSALQASCRKAAELSDIIELRLDCLHPAELEKLSDNVSQLLSNLSGPVILTLRPANQGGHRELIVDERLNFWKAQLHGGDAVWWDIESDFPVELPFEPDWSRVIISHHDFAAVPGNLAQIYERMANTRAQVVKLAVQANDIVDCIPVFQLFDRARREGREIIAIAMGNAGIATRILGPSRGAFLTYGALENESATAPGQVTARALRSIYRIQNIDQETFVCGLVGNPAMHSVSPHMHNSAFESERINGVYIPFEVRDVKSFFERMVHPRTKEVDFNWRGLSITAPHKANVMDCLDWIDPTAREIGAVNTVVVENDRLLGYNTDVDGLLEPLLGIMDSFEGLRVAVIGAGGAARAAVWALQHRGSIVTLFARDLAKARILAAPFDISCSPLSSASFADYDLVINATPLGSSGQLVDETPAIAKQLIGAGVVDDLVYNPVETRFLKEARKAGCKILGGLEMLVAQAKIQFELWTGQRPSSELMYDAASNALGRRGLDMPGDLSSTSQQ